MEYIVLSIAASIVLVLIAVSVLLFVMIPVIPGLINWSKDIDTKKKEQEEYKNELEGRKKMIIKILKKSMGALFRCATLLLAYFLVLLFYTLIFGKHLDGESNTIIAIFVVGASIIGYINDIDVKINKLMKKNVNRPRT